MNQKNPRKTILRRGPRTESVGPVGSDRPVDLRGTGDTDLAEAVKEMQGRFDATWLRLDEREKSLDDLNRKLKGAGKSWWDKLETLSKLAIAVILAVATIVSTVHLPKIFHAQSLETQKLINEQALETQKIMRLSELIGDLYRSPAQYEPGVIAMTSHGAPAVHFLLLALDHSVRTNNDDLSETITSAMRYMDRPARAEVIATLEMETERLSEQHLGSNVMYIDRMATILGSSPLEPEADRALVTYLSKVRQFQQSQLNDDLAHCNTNVLTVLAKSTGPLSERPLSGLSFRDDADKNDLRNIDFSDCDLTGCSFAACDLVGCNFDGAVLDNCKMKTALLIVGDEENEVIAEVFRAIATGARWQSATWDRDEHGLLVELHQPEPSPERLASLVRQVKVHQNVLGNERQEQAGSGE